MSLRSYVKVSAINLVILCAGIGIGRAWMPPRVEAQATPADPWNEVPEYIQPGFTVGSGGTE